LGRAGNQSIMRAVKLALLPSLIVAGNAGASERAC
jgi:hypothetical protein